MTQTYLEVHNLCKTFTAKNGSVEALKGVSLSIGKGEIFGVIGLSGAGKSTLVRCMNLLERPDSGDVLLNGESLLKLSKEQLRLRRQKIGMIFQHFNLLSSRTVYGNIAFPLEIQGMDKASIQKKVAPLLELVGLSDRADHYPSQLSGGQKQRVGIARALASDPKVLLCDEATSALDPQTTESILSLLRDINKRLHITIVMITHQMNVVKEICDRVAVIENGEIIEQGSMVDIFTNPQKATTKEFVASIQHNDLPDFVKKLDIHKEYRPGDKALVSLSFIGDSAGEPIVSVLIKQYDTNVNILTANIETLQDTPFGTLLIEVEGDEAHLKKALDYLHERKVKDEVIGYVS